MPIVNAETRSRLVTQLGFPRADVLVLYVLEVNERHYGTIADIAHRRAARQSLIAAIAAYAVDGKVRVVESGRDCDGVEYDGRMHVIDATPRAFDELHDRIGQWADGPFHLALIPPGQPDPDYTSRDLVAEAFEDGHPHHIVSRFA
jgi:hypothetical protein